MVSVTSADLARYQSLIASTLTDSCVNGRTNATIPCRFAPVEAHQRLVHLGNVQQYLRLRQWGVTFATAEDVRVGDLLTRAGVGYRVLDVTSVGTIPIKGGAYVALAHAGADILITDEVTFRRTDTGEKIGPVGVGISPISNQEHVTADGYAVTHVVIYDDTQIRYQDGEALTMKDLILWDELRDGKTTLHYPQHYVPIGVGMAYFKHA
jgi:hypothetical protein